MKNSEIIVKHNFSKYSKILILALMIIALIVFIGQVLKLNCWLLICLYWLVLTIKNLFDWLAR